MKKQNRLIYYGVWAQPLSMAVIVAYVRWNDVIVDSDTWIFFFGISMIPTIYIFLSNRMLKRNGKQEIGILDAFYNRPSPIAPCKRKAMYPDIHPSLLKKYPTGIVFGKFKNQYVCRDLQDDGHIFCIGGSGSGKSSCLIIPNLLINSNEIVFAIDIKGELSAKSVKKGDYRIKIFNPQDRNSYGYNPFYSISNEINDQQIMEMMQGITFSLIPMPSNIKDPFWKRSARNLLIGLLVFQFKSGIHDFVDIIDEILMKPIQESIEMVMKESSPYSIEYRYLVQFHNMADETISGVFAEMANHIVIFVNDQDIRYAFQTNPLKVNPRVLENGESVFLSIKEEKLSAYYDVLQLIINQTLSELEKRPEDSPPILFIIDELPRVVSEGKLDRLMDAVRTLRSRKVTLCLVTQSTEALMCAYSENEVADLISNCPYIMILSATSHKTQQSVISWCGKYQEQKKSWNGTGKDRKVTVSFEEKDIVTADELLTLPRSGDAILISPYGYNRIKKIPYYLDNKLKPLSDLVDRFNKNINEFGGK